MPLTQDAIKQFQLNKAEFTKPISENSARGPESAWIFMIWLQTPLPPGPEAGTHTFPSGHKANAVLVALGLRAFHQGIKLKCLFKDH